MAESVPVSDHIPAGESKTVPVEVENIKKRVEEVVQWVDSLEHKLAQVEEFYSTIAVSNSSPSSRHVVGIRKVQQEAARREAVAAKRMHDLMRQFGTIFRQITQHKCAWPFMHPVDVESLGLDDYYEVIDEPMDFSTIKNQMEAKDGTGYKHVMQIYADMRLVFENAMKYNEEGSDVYSMAKTLLAKFEEKWTHFLPKVQEEEKIREEEEKQAAMEALLAKEASHTKTTRDLSNEICNVNDELEKLRQVVVGRCRKITSEEKRNIGLAFLKLSPDELQKVLGVVAQADPRFQTKAEVVTIEMDVLDEPTLWRLKFLVKDALEKKKKEETIKTEECRGTKQNNEVSKKRNAVNKLAERRTKRPCL
ncbi:Transcription factor GTE6 [Raphanus sativus]|uniref:Transcription factor GTE6 n=1 Tax=Raphanus sativus TaxID=3726 RepID=A0A6J0N2I3_RAPSA|nr:transcription factor GTE6 [Raphanus sativus]KAJ4900158.1 Transcription factor GTE6 [Raphanus sativus]